MTEFLWTFAVQEVLKKIVRLAAEQIGLAWGLEKELPQLRKGLLKAETILVDINTKKLHHESVRLWVEDLQNIVYEADDLLDELVYEDLRRKMETGKMKKVRHSFSPSNNPFFFRYKMAKKMKGITETLYKHYCEASPLGLVGEESTETERALKQIRETTSSLDFEVVGRETEISNIVKLVIELSNEHHISVIPIVGMGGLGKTTLAKMVFNHDVIKGHFDKTIWICVSQPFIIINILEGIFQSLTNTSSGLNSKETLIQRLHEEMQNKIFFLVLDDVWDKENGLWDELSCCLKQIVGKSGNSIMVTTRSVEVATTIKTISIHHLRKLPDDQCWYLFKKSANIANEFSMNSKLEIMQKVLVQKIGGVPLVAKVLGGAVKFERDFEGDYESWMTRVETIARNISEEDKDFVLSILKLSVDCLPLLALKQCFAYCSNFPQDYNFEKDKLIQMWIAQEFIHPQKERDNLIMEDIGEVYFDFLLSRSLFQDVIKDKNGRIISFKMHDLMHDIACAISNRQKMELDPNNWGGKQAKLRTLACNNGEFHNTIMDYAFLRVLVLDSFQTNNLPISMCKLIHLRYLDISECSVNKPLLESLSMLYNLQTLKLGNIESLPKKLRKLINLRHLEFYEIHGIKQMPSHMGKLIHLQTLSQFAVGSEKGCKIEELGPLKNLKGTLNLTNLEEVKSKEEAIAAKLVEKKNLRQLFFQWHFFCEGEYDKCNNLEVLEGLQPHKNILSLNISGFRGEVFPNSIFVENLVEIHLFNCEKCEVLPMLGQLPNLKKLDVSSMNNVRSIGNEFYGIDSNKRDSFPRLKKLYIDGMKKLEQWDEATVESNLFGSLQKLSVSECDKLTKLPNGADGFNSIEYLIINHCPNLMLNVKNLPNLYRLDIDGLKRLPEGLAHLTNLKEMTITGCMRNYDFSPFIHLCSLTELGLFDDGSSNCNTTQLPEQLEHLTTLKVLKIADFNGIEVLPEWLGNLTSLEKLDLVNCKKLKQLPSGEAMLRLTKLHHLKVSRCPPLLLGEGEQEWAKLFHLQVYRCQEALIAKRRPARAKLSHLPTNSVLIIQ